MSESHPNALAASTEVPLFLCPSDAPSDNSIFLGSANPASSSYAGNIGWPSRVSGFDDERPVVVVNDDEFALFNGLFLFRTLHHPLLGTAAQSLVLLTFETALRTRR